MPAYLKIGDVKGDAVMARTETTMVATELLSPGSGPQPAGLLLPAVQKVREAASTSAAPRGPQGLQAVPQVPQLIGLLLPAVQKVREAASRNLPAGPGGITQGGSQPVGLLLPAVQKVREAASRTTGGAVAVHVHSTGSAGMLNAVRQNKVVNATVEMPDGGSVALTDAVVFDVQPAGKGLNVVIGFSRAS